MALSRGPCRKLGGASSQSWIDLGISAIALFHEPLPDPSGFISSRIVHGECERDLTRQTASRPFSPAQVEQEGTK